MARGLNGSANGTGHFPTGQEGVEARIPGRSGNVPPAIAEVLPAVVGLKTTIPPNRRSAQTLGAEREGHGIVIGDDGLIVTIGYLIMEADTVTVTDIEGSEWPAHIVGYDYESGFGLVRSDEPLGIKPMAFGDSDILSLRSEAVVVGYGGEKATLKVKVASRREFAGYWEYLLESAIFTVPAYPLWGGSALVGVDGALLGVGSLLVNEALGPGAPAFPGNMYVPINRLKHLTFGDSDSLELRSEAYVAGLGGEKATLKVKVAGRREFAGYWEYLLDNAIFTVPAYGLWAARP